MTKGYKLLGYKLADNIFYCLHHREIIALRGTRTQVQLRSTMQPVYWNICWRMAENGWSAMKS